ncbi:hypothetical protein FRC03_008267 [Tulasnella sp. 419]|nr:hypothetical protein FRC03_008267 [Tulasnella sp. 419]
MFLQQLLLLVLAAAAIAQSSATSIENVTYYSDDPLFVYAPHCPQDTRDSCRGAWWTDFDPKYGNGRARVSGTPPGESVSGEEYFRFTFEGTGFYMYQWVNKSTAAQNHFVDSILSPMDFTTGVNWPYPVNDEATLTLMLWRQGLKRGSHTISIKRDATPHKGGYIVFDHVVVEQLPYSPPSKSQNPNLGRIIGGSLAGTILLIAAVGLLIIYRRAQTAKALKKTQLALASTRETQFA